MTKSIVELEQVRFSHPGTNRGTRFGLHIERFGMSVGERVACIGASGTGKTTLVDLIAGIRLPSSGSVSLKGQDLTRLAGARRRELRVKNIGMVFQEFALLEYATVLDNVLLPYLLAPFLKRDNEVEQRAKRLAERLGIGQFLGRRPGQLSQGERQRVALCRALVTEPDLLLCDEATGNLDPEAASTAIDLLLEEARRRSSAVFLVTHDHSLLERFDRVVRMEELSAGGEPSDGSECAARVGGGEE